MRHLSFLLIFILSSFQIILGQSILGKWKTIDDRNGNTKAIVELYKEDGLLFGRIVKILEEGKENALCKKCTGDRKDKPIIGMTIIDGFEENNKDEYKGNTLFDPEQAMTFRGKIWLDPDNIDRLKVRGYLAFFYRTQTWHRVE